MMEIHDADLKPATADARRAGSVEGGDPVDGLDLVLSYLRAVPAWYLATSVGGQPHVRPFSFAARQDDKIWFCTATTKDVWEELVQNPRFEATAWWPGHGWLILRGRAGMQDAAAPGMREAGWRHLEGLGEHYEGSDDPTLVFFSAEEPEAWICNHDTWQPVDLDPVR